MAKILLQAWNQGGLADSKYSGIKNSLARMIGWDIHSKPGLLQVNQRMTKHSGATIDEFCKVAIDCSNGIRYWFSSTSGKIWQEKAGTYTLVHTNPAVNNVTQSVATLGGWEFDGNMYWATQNFLYKIPVSDADGASAWGSGGARMVGALNLYATSEQNGGFGYALGTSISETATDKYSFTGTNNILTGIGVAIDTLGDSNWTLTLHNSANTVVASKTITNANILVADEDNLNYVIFEFTTALNLIKDATYHIHLTKSAGTTSAIQSTTVNDMSTAQVAFFTESDNTYHPMRDVNLVLYIGDKNFVHQVDGDTFSVNALDLPKGYRVSALGKMRTDLLVGTIIASNVAHCEIFRWNTYGESFISQDTVYEPGINCFLEADNYTIINAGLVGNLYSYNGDQMTFYKKIPGTYSPTKQCIIYPNATALFGFLPIFGVSNYTGNPCDQGIYSLGKHSNNYTNVLNLEFPISQLDGSNYNRLSGVKIGAIIVSGNDIYQSWEYDGTFGVDKLDYSNKILKPFLETRIMSPIAGGFTTFNGYTATYEDLPASTSLVIKKSENSAAFGSALSFIDDSMRKQYDTRDERSEARTLSLRLEAVTNNNDAPTVQELVVDVS